MYLTSGILPLGDYTDFQDGTGWSTVKPTAVVSTTPRDGGIYNGRFISVLLQVHHNFLCVI